MLDTQPLFGIEQLLRALGSPGPQGEKPLGIRQSQIPNLPSPFPINPLNAEPQTQWQAETVAQEPFSPPRRIV
jgi:hypothetical protein